MSIYKTKTCGEICEKDVGEIVKIAGFVETIRDLGGLVFLDIRDMYGVTQVVTALDKPMQSGDVDLVAHIPVESSVVVEGKVRKRSEDTINPKIKTGLVEIFIDTIKIVGKRTKTLPFEVNSSQEVREV